MSIFSADAAGLLDEQIAALVTQPVRQASVAAQVSTVVGTSSATFRIPILTDDATSEWTAEGAEITPSDSAFDELVVTPKKLAGLVIVSRELADDSSPAAQQIVGESLAESIARKLDSAFFGSTVADGPDGLESLMGVSEVDTGAGIVNVDPFAEAISNAEVQGATLTSFVAHPSDVLALSKLKKLTSGSNEPLLTSDPTQPTRRVILGVPVISSAAVSPGTVWGIPQAKVYLVMREGTRLDVDSSAYFNRDSVAIRATLRAGIGLPHPAAVVKISGGGS